MERDFLGLEYGKDSVAMQMKDRSRSFQDSSGASVQWPYAKTCAPLHSPSTKAAGEDELKRVAIDQKSLYGFQPRKSRGNSDINYKSYCPFVPSQDPLLISRGGHEQHVMQINPYVINSSSSSFIHCLDDSTTVGELSSSKTPACFSSPVSQLTMFYGGTVTVYDNVTMDMAREIMLLAKKRNNVASASVNPRAQISNVNSIKLVHASLETNQLQGESQDQARAPDQFMPRAIPLARKASLSRFMETRKQRMINCIPYSCGDKKTHDSVDGFYDVNSSDKSRPAATIPGHTEELGCPSHQNSDTESEQSSLKY